MSDESDPPQPVNVQLVSSEGRTVSVQHRILYTGVDGQGHHLWDLPLTAEESFELRSQQLQLRIESLPPMCGMGVVRQRSSEENS